MAVVAHTQLPSDSNSDTRQETLEAHLVRLADLSPRAAVLEAWLQVEEAAMEASQRVGAELTSRELRQPLLLGQALEQAGLLDDQQLEIYHRLRNLRNAAAHAADFELEPEAALEYAELATRLATYLREKANTSPPARPNGHT